MKYTRLYKLFVVFSSTLFGTISLAQGILSEPEKEYLKLVSTDTVSSTVCYLPKGYWFGLGDPSDGRLIMVKKAKSTFFLRDGTHQVFILEGKAPGWKLRRLDSSIHSGDNYHLMAFVRKDTLYQYGGYGFWQTRDFFTRFREQAGDWEFLTGGQGLPNELCYHYYDPADDHFYVLGSLSSDHHPQAHKVFRDSTYRYDFTRRSWENLGPIRISVFEARNLGPEPKHIAITPFGMLNGHTETMALIDIRNNRQSRLRDAVADQYRLISRKEGKYNSDYTVILYLGDTLHILHGDADWSEHERIHLTQGSFDIANGATIYTPIGSRIVWDLSYGWMLGITGLSAIAISAFFIRRGRQHQAPVAAADPNRFPNDAAQDKVTDTGVVYFLNNLQAGEKALLEELVHASRSGLSLDAQEMNRVLGVAQRDPVTQKSRRSNSLARINQSWQQVMMSQVPLVIRERDDIDKRAFVYRVPASLLPEFEGHI